MFGVRQRPSEEALKRAAVISGAFERTDDDGDGVITFPELADVFRQLGSWTDSEIQALFDAADHNADGFVRYCEFTAWLEAAWDEGGKEVTETVASFPIIASPATSKLEAVETEIRLLCVRHAKPSWWDKKKHPAGTVRDPGLSDEGVAQAQKLIARLQADVSSFDVIICSPMARALETAAPLADVSAPVIRRAVCHAQICEYGSKPRDFDRQRIRAAQPKLFGANAAHEVELAGFGLDVPDDPQSRASFTAEWLIEQCKTWPRGAVIGIFSHQTFLDCLLQVLVLGDSSGWEYGWPKFEIAKAGFSEFVIANGKIKLVRDNVRDHLG